MAKEGASVVVAEAADQRGAESAAEIRNAGGQAVFMKVDVTNSSAIRAVVEEVLKEFGKIDILVNNAGIMQVEGFLEGDEQRWDKIIATNLKGVILFSRAVLDCMVERRSGKIINVASTAGLIGTPNQVVYGATKGGVVAFTRGLGAEMAGYHINVNAICPGFTETEAGAKRKKEEAEYFAKKAESNPWGRIAYPYDHAKLAVFLASDEAEYITCQCISVNGGASRM
jgi:2-hydroxycyclohexanecarboxyl-CoA dehydrogenase